MKLNVPVAVVGSGAIAEDFYVPALRKFSDYAEKVWIVDPSPSRLSFIAQKYGFSPDRSVQDISQLGPDVVAAFNCTPSHLHVDTSVALIERGVAVYLEKPFAERSADARRILDLSDARGLPLSVNQYRRRFPAYMTIREYLSSGRIGAVRRLSWSEGGKFDWPTQSGFYFRRPWADGQPRGALLDTGAHIVDVICWWLGGTPTVESAWTDSYGGPEAQVVAKLAHEAAAVDLRISFLAKLPNEYLIEGDEGTIRGACYDTRRFYFQPRGGAERAVICRGVSDRGEIGDELVANFVVAAQGRAQPLIDARSVIPSLEVIDSVYAAASPSLGTYYKEWRP